MRFKKSFLILPLVAMISISALLMGCIDEQITDEQLTDRISTSYEDIQTYQLDMDMTVNISGQEDGESIDTAIPIKGSYSLDIPHQKAHVEMIMTVPEELQSQGLPETLTTSIYLVDNTIYLNGEQVLGQGSPIQWIKMGIPAYDYKQNIDAQNIVKQLSGLLSGMYQIAITDKVMVNNTDCYEVTLSPDTKKIFSLLTFMQSTGGMNFGQMDADQIDQLVSAIEGLSVRQWFDTKDFSPVKANLTMSLDNPEENFAMSVNAVLDFKNINGDLLIELPAGAYSATDLVEVLSSMGLQLN